MHCILTGLLWQNKKTWYVILKSKVELTSPPPPHTHKETLLFMLLLACVPEFFLLGPYIAEELAPHILHIGPQHWVLAPCLCRARDAREKNNRRRDKVVKKRVKTTGRHPDSWALRWSLCLAFRCLSRLRFGGGVVTKEADKEKLVHRDQESEGGREGKNEKML